MFFSQTGETALHRASARGHVKIVDLLIKAKAHIDAVEKVWKCTLGDIQYYQIHFPGWQDTTLLGFIQRTHSSSEATHRE